MSEQKLLFSNLYDLADTAGYRYGVYSEVIVGEKAIKTSGSSTTVSENTTGDAVFQGRANGDLIHTKSGADSATTTRIITDATNAPTSVVVNSAVTLTSPTFWRYQKWHNGTGASDGWFSVAEFNDWSVALEWVTDAAASVEWVIEGRINGGTAEVLESGSFTAVGALTQPGYYYVGEIRVGFKITTDGGANNVKANFIGERFV
jgi:hypothetical protein